MFEINLQYKKTSWHFINRDKSTWAIGGTTLLGLGIGFFLLKTSILWFVGSLLAGIGLGLVITAIISGKKEVE